MEQMKQIKHTLLNAVQTQIQNLEQVDAKELGEIVDMIKDLDEAMYYCSIIKAMEEEGRDPQNSYSRRFREMNNGQMYYDDWNQPGHPGRHDMMHNPMEPYWYGGSSGNTSSSSGNTNSSGGNNARGGGTRGYMTGMNRYFDSKQQHMPKDIQMRELENYLRDLSQDVSELIQDASPEEKMMLQQKLSMLATKVNV